MTTRAPAVILTTIVSKFRISQLSPIIWMTFLLGPHGCLGKLNILALVRRQIWGASQKCFQYNFPSSIMFCFSNTKDCMDLRHFRMIVKNFLPLTYWNESCQTNWVYWGSFSVYQLKMCWYHNDDGIWYHNISGLIDQKGAFARSEDMVGCGRVSDNITKEHFLSRELFQRQDKKIFDLQHIEMFQYIKINAIIKIFLK